MKKVAIILAVVFGIAANVMADNVIPANAAKAEISFNGSNHLVVALSNIESQNVRLKIYNSSFDLVYNARIDAEESKEYSLASLPVGNYVVKIEKDGEVIHTEMVKNVK